MNCKFVFLGLLFLILTVVLQVTGQDTGSIPVTRLQTRYTGLSSPIFLTHAGDGTKRIFIVERAGVIRVAQPGSNTRTTFLNITPLVITTGERGLLGLAFHPEYKTNRRFFVYYTGTNGDLRISEFEVSPDNPNVALQTEKPILTIEHPQNNHNGGTIAFGPDGFLYAAPGDGSGGGNDPANNAQNNDSLLGKVLRIDVDVPAGQTVPYAIPPTNPFAGATPGRDEIFANGFRNPFRWSFDRGGAGQLWLADVGQEGWEEVDIVVNGGNYGWRIFEGNTCTDLGPDPCTTANYVAPVFVYSSQPTTSRCAITGGYVYRGSLGTLPNGSYIYGDYCTGEILMWHNGQQIPIHDIPDFNLVSFGEDEDGELYAVHAGGRIQKIVPAQANADFDGDFRTDYSVFRPSSNTWYIINSQTGFIRTRIFGFPDALIAPEDYDGDRITDIAHFNPVTGLWGYVTSRDSVARTVDWGESGDIPAAGDYDGDGRADFVLYRPSNGTWYTVRSSDGRFGGVRWGEAGDIPAPGDYDGDGRYDLTVWRPSNGRWYTIFSTNNSINVNQYGESNDIPATGDFDGDGRNDLSVFRPSTGQWFRKLSSNNNFSIVAWGVQGDAPVVGDYDADDRDDIAVWRPTNGTWYVIRSSGGLVHIPAWGVAGDVPAQNGDNP